MSELAAVRTVSRQLMTLGTSGRPLQRRSFNGRCPLGAPMCTTTSGMRLEGTSP